MLDLTWLKEKQLVAPIKENQWRITPVDNIGIEDALQFIKSINATDNMHIADKTSSFARYSRLGLTITPAYLSTRASIKAKRRRVHPLGLIQYIAASMLISGSTFSLTGHFMECAKARESDIFYGTLCFYIKELEYLRAVLPMDQRDTLNLTKIFDKNTIMKKLPPFNMATDIADFEYLRSIYVDKQVRPIYQNDTDTYTAFWEMMYYRTFCGCFNRYMPEVLQLALG